MTSLDFNAFPISGDIAKCFIFQFAYYYIFPHLIKLEYHQYFFLIKKVLLVLQLAKMMKKIVMLKEPADLRNSPVRLVQKIQVEVLE